VTVLGTAWMIADVGATTGEEIGWYGFLVPELAKVLPFTVVAIAISFAQAWMRLKTGSIWPPIFLHASHNLWTQSVFTPLTTDLDFRSFRGLGERSCWSAVTAVVYVSGEVVGVSA
jgi:membrane protease YdiL (CAAX protease family)